MLPRILSIFLLLPWHLVPALRRFDPTQTGDDVELSLLARASSLAEGAKPCVEQSRGLVQFTCSDFNLGNALMMYWNGRAAALFQDADFALTSRRTDLVSQFPRSVPRGRRPTELQAELWRKMRAMPNVCWSCPFPHCATYAPWRLIGDTILTETASVVGKAIGEGGSDVQSRTNWAHRQTWAVFHFRCDRTLWKNEGYGFLRYRFIGERLPSTTTHMLIVGPTKSSEPLCREVAQDLAEWLQEARHLTVVLQESEGKEVDWLTLATAPLLFCSSSTFCLTAAMGNPNTVYYPVNGENLAVFAEGPAIEQAGALRSRGFHWVPTDYLPGPAVPDLAAEDLRAYFRAGSCDQARHRCVPLGGSIPPQYRFHAKH
mmetsp:Transcript_122923/g.298425  ORF Transcript_122923/g.298425 Transcript_122923/m.298425 type:complete len:373 (+) Transcript_122923:111-1229(+)